MVEVIEVVKVMEMMEVCTGGDCDNGGSCYGRGELVVGTVAMVEGGCGDSRKCFPKT